MQKIASMHHQIFWCFLNYKRILDERKEELMKVTNKLNTIALHHGKAALTITI